MSDDLSKRIDALEAKIDALTKEVMEERAESVRSRIEELEVRANLLAKNVRDEAMPVLESLRNNALDAMAMAQGARDSAGDALTEAAHRVSGTIEDLRVRVEEVANRLRSSGSD
jgi:hypothetical protein